MLMYAGLFLLPAPEHFKYKKKEEEEMQELASFLCVIDISASIHPSKQTARLRW